MALNEAKSDLRTPIRATFLTRHPWLASTLGRLANVVIVVLFTRITMVLEGVGTIGFIIKNGAPDAWGTQIALSKATIVLLLMAVILPGIRPSRLVTLVGCITAGVAWVAFLNELSFHSQGYFVVDSLPFVFLLLLQMVVTVVQLRFGTELKQLTKADWISLEHFSH